MVFSIFSPPDLHTCPLGNVSERSLDIEDEELQSSYSHITPPLVDCIRLSLSQSNYIFFCFACKCELQIF